MTEDEKEIKRKTRMPRSKYYLTKNRPGKEIIKRICLKCDRNFYAVNKFNRTCDECKKTLSYQYGSTFE